MTKKSREIYLSGVTDCLYIIDKMIKTCVDNNIEGRHDEKIRILKLATERIVKHTGVDYEVKEIVKK